MEQLSLPNFWLFFSFYIHVFATESIVLSVSSQDDRFFTAQLRAGAPAARGALSAAAVTGNSAVTFAGFSWISSDWAVCFSRVLFYFPIMAVVPTCQSLICTDSKMHLNLVPKMGAKLALAQRPSIIVFSQQNPPGLGVL